jgi:hypothetical protein
MFAPATLLQVINNLYPHPDEASLARNMSQHSQPSQLRSRPLADATNITATASAQASGTPKHSAAASKESSSFSLASATAAAASQHSAQWFQASAAAADAAAAGQQYAVADDPSGQPMPLAVAATPEQLSMMVTAATAAATKAVTETLLHSRQSRRSSKDSSAHQCSAIEQQVQVQQAHQQQQDVAKQGSFQQPEQQLLRLAEAPGALAGTSGLLSRQQSGSTAAAGLGQAVRVAPLQGPIIRIPAAATTSVATGAAATDDQSGLVVVDGLGTAGGAVRFPRLWPEQAVQAPCTQEQQQYEQLLPERSRASAAAERGSAGAAVVAEEDSAGSSAHQQQPADSTLVGTQGAGSSVSTAEVAQVEDLAAASAGSGLVISVPVITSSNTALQDDAQTVPSVANEQRPGAAASSSAHQKLCTGPVAGHAPGVAAPVVGSYSPAAAAAAAAPRVRQPVVLPVELDSAVQRALKSLTDPAPPRPLLAPEQTPAAVQQQHQRQLDADRCAVVLL